MVSSNDKIIIINVREMLDRLQNYYFLIQRLEKLFCHNCTICWSCWTIRYKKVQQFCNIYLVIIYVSY